MKNKTKIIITIFLLFTLLLTGCASLTEVDHEYDSNLIYIKDDLYYYKKTKVVYIIFNKGVGICLSPYYSSNGNLCKFDEETNSFIEIKINRWL